MIKKLFGYTLMICGFLCFILVGGGSMRFRNRNLGLHDSVGEDLINVGKILLIPVTGFILMKLGYKIVSKTDKN